MGAARSAEPSTPVVNRRFSREQGALHTAETRSVGRPGIYSRHKANSRISSLLKHASQSINASLLCISLPPALPTHGWVKLSCGRPSDLKCSVARSCDFFLSQGRESSTLDGFLYLVELPFLFLPRARPGYRGALQGRGRVPQELQNECGLQPPRYRFRAFRPKPRLFPQPV